MFFYDYQHWGYSKDDKGYAVVLHQNGDIQLTKKDLPVYERKYLLGFRKKLVQPTVYKKVFVSFKKSVSYPSLERDLINWKTEAEEEEYSEFLAETAEDIQVGGYPNPIQSDFMEDECIKANEIGEREDWFLLLQLFEVSDMVWGDTGALYWFILRDDLAHKRFQRAWMVFQCH